MTARLLILAAGWEQQPLVERALSEGFDVVAVGPQGSVIEPLVPEYHAIDARDLPALYALAVRSGIDAVVSDQDDYARYAQAWLSERLNLPGPLLGAVAPTTRKDWLRDLCQAVDIPQPAYRFARCLREARTSAEELLWPIIVKPVDNRGSFGVIRVDEPHQLDEAVSDALAHSHSRTVILEQFIDGTVVTVDGAHGEDGHRILGIASKRQVAGRRQVAMELYYPAVLPEAGICRATENANAVASMLRRRGATGLTHTEFVFDGDEMWLLETANRGGGVYTSNVILPIHSGFDTNGYLLAEATGRASTIDGSRNSGSAVILSFVPLKAGRIAAIRGIDNVRSSPGVLAARLNIVAGDNVGDVETAVSRAGFVIAAGHNLAEARRRVEEALAHLDIKYG